MCAGFGWFSSVAEAVLCVSLIRASCACMAAVLCLVRAECVVCLCVAGFDSPAERARGGMHTAATRHQFCLHVASSLAGHLLQGQQL